MKRVFAAIVLTLGFSVASAAAAHADPISDATPSCTVYVSQQTVPVSANCLPYYVNGVLVFNALSVNE